MSTEKYFFVIGKNNSASTVTNGDCALALVLGTIGSGGDCGERDPWRTRALWKGAEATPSQLMAAMWGFRAGIVRSLGIFFFKGSQKSAFLM